MDYLTITFALVVMTSYISYTAFNKPMMKAKLMFYPVQVNENKEYYRFLTHGFLHANWEHLIFNMYVLFVFGAFVENQFNEIFGYAFGPVAFILFYLSAIVVAAIPDYFRHKDYKGYASLGASGATSALVFVYVFFDPWAWFLIPPLPAIIMAVLFLLYSSYMDKKGTDNIGHNAHFWGAVYGAVFIFISAQAFKPEFIDQFIYRLTTEIPWFS